MSSPLILRHSLLTLLLSVTPLAGQVVVAAEPISQLKQQKQRLGELWFRDANVNLDEEFHFFDAFRASLAWLDADLDAATSSNERIQAIQRHLQRMSKIQEEIQAWRKLEGDLTVSKLEAAEVDYRVVEAKIWLKQEQLRQTGSSNEYRCR